MSKPGQRPEVGAGAPGLGPATIDVVISDMTVRVGPGVEVAALERVLRAVRSLT